MDIIYTFFYKLGETFCGRLSRMIGSMVDCYNVSTTAIAISMAKITNISFNAARMFVYRFLDDVEFVVGEKLWRCYQTLLFHSLEKQGGIKTGDLLQINIDFTTIENRYNILCASIIINKEKAVMLYFNIRRYQQKKGIFNQKKMEEAFLNSLKRLLPTRFNYLIVGDRGFGHERIINICEKHKFKYSLRRSGDIKIIVNGEKKKLEDFAGQNCVFTARVVTWKKDVKFLVKTKKGNNIGTKNDDKENTWYIMTNLEDDLNEGVYEKRFKIEKLFQDWKGLGFDLEKTKIELEDRVKRLIFLVGITHMLTTFVGYFAKHVKKKCPTHYLAVVAYFRLEKKL
jgi:hypothetical protein